MERLSKLNMEEIVTGIPGGFFIYKADDSKEIIYANSEIIRMYGCHTRQEFDEFTKNSFRAMVHPEDLDKVEKSISRQVSGNQRNLDNVEYRIIRKDGELRWVEDFGHLVQSSVYGSVFYVFVSDVTEKKELTLERERGYIDRLTDHAFISKALQSTLYAYSEIYVLDLEKDFFRMIYPEGRGIKGSYSKEVENRILSGKIYSENTERLKKLMKIGTVRESLMKQNSVEYQYVRRTEEGQPERSVTLFAVGKCSEDGTPVSAVIAIRSIENILQRDERQHEILENALLQAEKANEAKTVFLANMSHDMRTPMNAIIGFTELAIRHMDDREALFGYLQKIRFSSDALIGLIDDVLDMSRIESGRMKMKESYCSIIKIVENVLDSLKKHIEEKKLTYGLDMHGIKNRYIFCDELRLTQVLINVIGNAVKYTEPGGKIAILVTQKKSFGRKAFQYEFRIRDTGIGMTPEFLDKIFLPFERERTSTVSQIKGTGLGLAVTKRIVDLMNGTIEVSSEVGRGSEFVICLPFRIRNTRQTSAQPKDVRLSQSTEKQESKSLEGKRILLVDDNELNREIAKALFEESGLIVEEAEDGTVALQKLEGLTVPYDCIIMDIQMPCMNGYNATKAIRALDNPALSKIPIIGLSANAFEEDRRKALAVGMDAYVAKPIDMDIVLKTIRKFV